MRHVRHTNKDQIAAWTAHGASYFYSIFDPQFTILLLGLGSFTFRYGEGLSYFSKNLAACINCHIMKPPFDSWQKASHHTLAT